MSFKRVRFLPEPRQARGQKRGAARQALAPAVTYEKQKGGSNGE